MRSNRDGDQVYSKVLMSSIQALTFQRGAETAARRGPPIPQLTCIGKACSRYQPETVACFNIGSDGAGGVQWRCEADLPPSLRLGSVQVSCEGWNKPGDRYVLQGSCGLEYGLVQVDPGMESGQNIAWMKSQPGIWKSLPSILFSVVFFLVLSIILYSFLRSCLSRTRYPLPPPRRYFPFLGWFGGGGPGGGGGGGGPPPPPYTRHPKPDPATATPSGTGTGPGGMGFWTGLGLGGLGAYLATRPRAEPQYRTAFDRPMGFEGVDDRWGGRRRRGFVDETGGGGESSRMGEMRRATGFGGTNVR